MSEIILFVGLSLSTCTITAYRSVPNQTDSSPNFTSIGERTHKGGVAISRDLLCKACMKLHKRCARPDNPSKVHYGDYISIDHLGIYQVNDVMGATQYDRVHHKRVPIRRHFDIWVASLKEEKTIKPQLQNVYIIKKETK